MRTRILAAATAASLALSGCALFMTPDQLAEARYAARDPVAHHAGPIYEGPPVTGGLLRGGFDRGPDVLNPWLDADIRVRGPIDDSMGLQSGIAN